MEAALEGALEPAPAPLVQPEPLAPQETPVTPEGPTTPGTPQVSDQESHLPLL